MYAEFKRTIAAETARCFSSDDMIVKKQIEKAFNIYHGTADGLVSQITKFVEGKDCYKNLWETVDTQNGAVRAIPEWLHRQEGKVLVAGKNITEAYLNRSFKRTGPLLAGRSIRGYAAATARQAKKMLSLIDEAVQDKILVKDGEDYTYFSGKNLTDFIDFLLFRMFNWKYYNGATEGEGQFTENGDTEADGAGEIKDAGAVANLHGATSEEASDFDDDQLQPKELNVQLANGDGDEEANDGDDDEDAGDLKLQQPPADYLPEGFVFFMTRGPLAEKEYRVDLLALGNYLESDGGGRIQYRKDKAKKKDAKRDYDRGTVVDDRQARGLALGAENQKEVALIAQNQAKLCNQSYETEVVKLDMVLKTKGDQMRAELDMAKLYQSMGETALAKAHMDAAKEIIKAMKGTEAELAGLKNQSVSQSVEVNEYLKRGRMAMGIMESGKKAKKNQKTVPADDEEDSGEDSTRGPI